jgi:hypothetical protein
VQQVFLDLATRLEGIARPQDLADYRDFVEHGEGVVALENLCENLYEYDIPLPRPIFEQIAATAQAAGVRAHRWNFVERLVR